MRNVIDYVPGSSRPHQLNPVTKLAMAATIIIATLLAQSWAALVGLFLITLGLKRLRRRLFASGEPSRRCSSPSPC